MVSSPRVSKTRGIGSGMDVITADILSERSAQLGMDVEDAQVSRREIVSTFLEYKRAS